MNNLQVLFEVPAWIEAGLQNGTYERLGGVIREAGNGRVVMWLRDSAIANELMTVRPLPVNPAQAMNIAAPYLTAINVGVSIAGFTLVLQQLNLLTEQVRSLEHKMNRVSDKLDDQYLAKLKAGINAYCNAVVLQDFALRRQMAGAALTTLHEARQYFNQQVLRSAGKAEAPSAQYVAIAFTALMAEAQTYIQLDEAKQAAQVLREGVNDLQPGLTQLMEAVLEQQATYLKPELQGKIDLDFITWLHNGLRRMQQAPGEASKVVTASEVFDLMRNSGELLKAFKSDASWHGKIPQVLVNTAHVKDSYLGPIKTGTDTAERLKLVQEELSGGLMKIAALVEAHDRLCGQAVQLEEMERLGLRPSSLAAITILPEGEAQAVLMGSAQNWGTCSVAATRDN